MFHSPSSLVVVSRRLSLLYTFPSVLRRLLVRVGGRASLRGTSVQEVLTVIRIAIDHKENEFTNYVF